ncbi:tetratricopeptide repeat protein [Candidatus Omnitrophota bacterium]
MLKKITLFICCIGLLLVGVRIAAVNVDYAALGNKHFLNKEYDKAAELYEKAIDKGFRSFDVFYNLGFIYYHEKKDLAKAENVFRQGLEVYPQEGLLHATLSQLYFEMNNFPKGVEEYKLAAKYGVGRPLTIYTEKVKELLRQQGKSKEEIAKFFEKIISLNPDDYFALFEVAEGHKLNGAYEVAIDEYKRILVLSPNMPMVYSGIGSCYYKLGDLQLAFEYLKKAKDVGEFVPEAFFDKLEKEVQSTPTKP